MPQLNASGSNAIFTFKRVDAAETDTTHLFQWSTDLQNWNDVAIGATSAGDVTIVENAAAADDISVSISKGSNTKLFGRVKVIKP